VRTARAAFTIIELLIVMAIIIVLAGLILATSGYVQDKGKRSRAEAEIAAMSAALESYKADNGVYPTSEALDPRDRSDPTSSAQTQYQTASKDLYAALSGDINLDRSVTTADSVPPGSGIVPKTRPFVIRLETATATRPLGKPEELLVTIQHSTCGRALVKKRTTRRLSNISSANW
jgi:type II secretory pathway pseudopilin PulG